MLPVSFLGFSDPVSSLSHLLAACAALVGTGLLIGKGRGNGARITALVVFSFALVFLFSMSGVFHLLERGSVARDVLQRLDHAGIWVLIAATFAPIHVILFRGHRRWTVLAAVWVFAITALVLEIVFFEDVPEGILVTLFLALGWVGGLSGFFFRKAYGDPSIWALVAGGVLYSIGAIIDFSKWPVLIDGVLGPHEIFHFFIMAAAFAHWRFVYRWANHPVHNTLTFHVFILSDRVRAEAVSEKMEIIAPTLVEVKELIRATVAKRYHSTIRPVIRLRYFNEEEIV